MSSGDYLEERRAERWHEVYMSVLRASLTPPPMYNQMQFSGYGTGTVLIDAEAAHTRAKTVADKAYPPLEVK